MGRATRCCIGNQSLKLWWGPRPSPGTQDQARPRPAVMVGVGGTQHGWWHQYTVTLKGICEKVSGLSLQRPSFSAHGTEGRVSTATNYRATPQRKAETLSCMGFLTLSAGSSPPSCFSHLRPRWGPGGVQLSLAWERFKVLGVQSEIQKKQ